MGEVVEMVPRDGIAASRCGVEEGPFEEAADLPFEDRSVQEDLSRVVAFHFVRVSFSPGARVRQVDGTVCRGRAAPEAVHLEGRHARVSSVGEAACHQVEATSHDLSYRCTLYKTTTVL